jgi:hypothetical protein
MCLRIGRLALVAAAAALLISAADLAALAAGHHWFVMLIKNAIPNSAHAQTIRDITTGLSSIQGQVQGFAVAAAPIALGAAGISWAAGNRRGIGMAGAALGGLALALLAGPIAN